MKFKYYILLLLLVFIGVVVLFVLISRAQQADNYFEYQKNLQLQEQLEFQ